MILVCIRFHVILESCDCFMKCIFVWTQVVNKLLLLLSSVSFIYHYRSNLSACMLCLMHMNHRS